MAKYTLIKESQPGIFEVKDEKGQIKMLTTDEWYNYLYLNENQNEVIKLKDPNKFKRV